MPPRPRPDPVEMTAPLPAPARAPARPDPEEITAPLPRPRPDPEEITAPLPRPRPDPVARPREPAPPRAVVARVAPVEATTGATTGTLRRATPVLLTGLRTLVATVSTTVLGTWTDSSLVTGTWTSL